MTDRKIWIAVVGLALVAAYLQVRVFQLDQQLKDAGRLREELASLAAESVQSIESAGQATLKSFRETVASDLASVAKTVSDEQARALEERLKRLNVEVSKLEAESRNAQAERDRVLNGLPEHVELDELNDYYAARWKQKTGYIGTVETFNTSQGSIGFQKNHFSFAYIPSSKRLAWLKIGKDAVTENAELIKAWLDESARAKGRLGYVRQYRTTKPSDYGEYTPKLSTARGTCTSRRTFSTSASKERMTATRCSTRTTLRPAPMPGNSSMSSSSTTRSWEARNEAAC